MKLKGLALLVAFNLSLCSMPSYAAITVYTPNWVAGDVCEMIAGHWTGKGKVTAAHIVTCVYKGAGDITKSDTSKFIMNITFNKDPKESSFLCPPSETLQLQGDCKNGVIVLKQDDADLHGDLKMDGKTIDMLGTVSFAVGGMTVKANVDYMHLTK